MWIHCSSTCIWRISFSVDTVYTLQQHLYMEYIFTCGYIAAAPVYGVYFSQLIQWIHCSSTCIWSISFSVDTVDTLQQHLYMEYIFTCGYIAAAPVYGVYLSQLIRWIHCSSTCIWSISFSVDTVDTLQQHMYMEYIFLSDTVDTLQQHLYMEYIFTCGYIAAAPVYGVYLSQLIRCIHCSSTCIWSISLHVDTLQQHLYMEYIFLS